jgi:AcrR family transcriptional regulator
MYQEVYQMDSETEKLTQSQKILTAAFNCISTKGYANVSLRDIADEAGVVLSQLNYYYKNKEGLFTEVIKTAIQMYLQEIENNLQKGTTIKEKMSFLTKYFRKMLIETPELFRLLYDFIGMSMWSDSFSKLLRQLFQDLSDLIEKNILMNISINGKFMGYSPKIIARMIIGALFGITIQSILDPEKETLSDALNLIPVVFE